MTEHRETAHHIQERPLSALDAIFMRRSVRAYTPHTVDESTIRSLLDAAVQAPTAMHLEPWAFVVVQDEATLKRYSDRAKGKLGQRGRKVSRPARWCRRDNREGVRRAIQESGLLHLLRREHADRHLRTSRWDRSSSADCWLAAENLMLAASALGLGTCCIGSAIPVLNSPGAKSELGIPADVEAVAPIIVGVPSGPATEVPRKDPQVLHWK